MGSGCQPCVKAVGRALEWLDQLALRQTLPDPEWRTTNDQRLNTMFERLDQIEARYDELTQALASPEIMNDSAKYQKTAKAHSEIQSYRRAIPRIQGFEARHCREPGYAG